MACMHALRLLDTVWPSAIRAWELLVGSKANLTLTGADASAHAAPFDASPPAHPAPPPIHRERQVHKERLSHKRSAETFMSDETRFFPPSSTVRLPYATANATAAAATRPLPTESFYASPPSYERWGSSADVPPFSESLSTSGLPQQYSTGFIDRLPPLSAPAAPAPAPGSGTRYPPQYWNDYASLNPLGVPFGGQDRGAHAQGQHAPQQGHGLFGLQDHQYHMYSTSLPTLFLVPQLWLTDDCAAQTRRTRRDNL
jgi:hypothetical protein